MSQTLIPTPPTPSPSSSSSSSLFSNLTIPHSSLHSKLRISQPTRVRPIRSRQPRLLSSRNSGSADNPRWSLSGMTALVTGGTRGIGHAIVEELAGLGATVHTCCRNSSELDVCLREWDNLGFGVTGSVCDVSVRVQREELVGTVSSVFDGKLNILVRAINQLTKSLACEWAKDNIRSNAVAPWYIRTSMVEQVLSNKEFLEEVYSRTPLGRLGDPKEVSSLVAFLCLPASSYITAPGHCPLMSAVHLIPRQLPVVGLKSMGILNPSTREMSMKSMLPNWFRAYSARVLGGTPQPVHCIFLQRIQQYIYMDCI